MRYAQPFPLIILLLSVFSAQGLGQMNRKQPVPTLPKYYTKIHYWDNSVSSKGVLLQIEEKGISWVDMDRYRSIMFRKLYAQVEPIPFNKVESISFQRRGRFGKNVLRGALIGGVVLGIVAVAINEPCRGSFFCVEFSDSQVFTGGLILGGLGGAVIGGMISPLIQKRVPIKGKYSSYIDRKTTIDKYMIDNP